MEGKSAANIVIAGGSKPDLFECLLSLAESPYAPCETVVVDNSTDGLCEELAVSFPKVRIIRASKRLTFAQAANLGVRAAFARGASIALLLHDDVTVHRDALSALAAAEAQSGPGIYAPEVRPYKSGAPRKRFRLDWAKRLIVTEFVCEGSGGPLDYAEDSAMLISARVFEALGGFDEALGFYYEDTDFSVRAADAGFPVTEVAGARAWHKEGVSAGSGLSPFKAYWRARNALKFAAKHRKRARLCANALYHFGEFVIPESVKAAAGMLAGDRDSAKVLAAIMRGTCDLFTGNGHAARLYASPSIDPGGRTIPLSELS